MVGYMKKVMKVLRVSVLTVVFAFASFYAKADVPYKLDMQNSTIIISGTSTLHDWEMNVEELSGRLSITDAMDKLVSGDLTIVVESIISEHSLMNKKTYSALKEDDFPQITVKLIQAEGNQTSENAQVELTIAGVTKKVSDAYQLKDLGNGKLSITGELELKMSDYDVEPPVVLMGTIKTGDEIKVEYYLVYQK